MRRNASVGVLVLALVAGCSSSGDEPSASALVEAWRVEAVAPIAQPVAVGDMVVAYVTVGKDLLLVGLPMREGGIRWRQAASPSQALSGIPMTPRVIDGQVAYFRPDRIAPLAARLVVASPQTGADLLVSEPMTFASQPSRCPDGKDVCVTVFAEGNRMKSRRFSVAAGGPVPDAGAYPPGSRPLGTNLLDLGQRPEETLAGFRDGIVRWRAPLSRHFSPGYSSDQGWSFELYKSAGLHVGSVGSPSDRSGAVANVRDWSKVETAAIRVSDGSPAWRSEGTSFLCDSKVELERKVTGGESERWPVRCRMRGKASYERATGNATFEGLDITLEGFDLATGNTTWSVPLGAAEVFMEEHRNATAVSDVEVLVHSGTGPLIVDLSNGSTRRPAATEVFWCSERGFFEYREARLYRDGQTSNTWRRGDLLFSCAPDGSPSLATPAFLPSSLGATVDGRTVTAQENGLFAYDRA
jgi:hypothetical protein